MVKGGRLFRYLILPVGEVNGVLEASSSGLDDLEIASDVYGAGKAEGCHKQQSRRLE